MIEGPEEIDPAHLAQGVRAELLLRNPESYTKDEDGNITVLSPDVRWLTWSEVPLIEDPANCEHCFSVCSDCADSWGQDHYIRFFKDGYCIWLSPDHPDHPGDPGETGVLPG